MFDFIFKKWRKYLWIRKRLRLYDSGSRHKKVNYQFRNHCVLKNADNNKVFIQNFHDSRVHINGEVLKTKS